MKALFVNIGESSTYYNLGDRVSSPAYYLPGLEKYPWASYQHFQTHLQPGQPVIFGGGGLFMRDFAGLALKIARKQPVVIWGAGLNYARHTIPSTVTQLCKTAALAGFRDQSLQEYGATWVPCASCLAPEFDEVRDMRPAHKFSVYSHGDAIIPSRLIPVTNKDRSLSFRDVLDYLADSEIVVTNSYHGAYWAQLLGRLAVLYFPDGKPPQRFITGLPYQAPIIMKLEWLGYPLPTPPPPFLEQARGRNIAFYGKVRKFIDFPAA